MGIIRARSDPFLGQKWVDNETSPFWPFFQLRTKFAKTEILGWDPNLTPQNQESPLRGTKGSISPAPKWAKMGKSKMTLKLTPKNQESPLRGT